MTDLTNVPDAELVREIHLRIKGESEMHYHRNYLYREALRPIYLFFDKQDIDEANIRMRKQPDWEQMEAACRSAGVLPRPMTGCRAGYGLWPSDGRVETSSGTSLRPEAMHDGPVAGLGLIDTILARGGPGDYHLAHSARPDLCRRLGDHPEIIATADIGCYAYPRRETHVPVVHGTENLV